MSTSATDETTAAAENVRVAEHFAEVFSTGDVDAILECMHPEATYWVAGSIEGMSGTYTREQFGDLLRGVTEAYSGGALPITPTGAIAQGNKVAVEATSRAELKNGRVYANTYHFLFEVKDGLVFRVKEYMDTHHAVEIFYS